MEIRNALQKIENYLTVVSNLNKTILSEGTMSRDELLLMKKYLYTSIDRVEDIERLLVIDRKDEKSFTPTETSIETYTAPKSKEIVEVVENAHLEEVEATLTTEEKKEVEAAVEEIHAELEKEETLAEEKIEAVEEESVEEVKSEIVSPLIEPVAYEVFPEVENIITEDFAVDELKKPLVQQEEKETLLPFMQKKDEVEEKKEEQPLVANKEEKMETISAKFSENKLTFAEELAKKKKEEMPLFEQLNQKLNTTPQQQLFEMFDDEKEELHETFMKSSYEPIATNFDDTSAEYSNETVLVAEKEAEPAKEELTPSSLNEVFRPQVPVVDTVVPKVQKTFSESIALNDKFIFVRELFGNQFAEYEHGLKQLDQLASFQAAEMYCKENLWNKFSWGVKPTAVQRFMDLLQKKFN